jgi:hypothetical protein
LFAIRGFMSGSGGWMLGASALSNHRLRASAYLRVSQSSHMSPAG